MTNRAYIKLRCLVYMAIVLGAMSCSTTSRLADDEVLYTGVKKLNIMPKADSIVLDDAVAEGIASAINVAPNNSLYSPYIRHPRVVGIQPLERQRRRFKGLAV